MASTIKLKNSTTAGNAPSSLAQGEVAINVADGGLFYGTVGGTSVSSSLLLSDITASGNISGSINTDLTIGNTGSFGYIQMNDGKEIAFGNSQDLRIFHDGSHSRIKDGGTGQIKIQGGTAVNIISPADESMGVFTANGGVDLYFNNQKKFEVETGGVNVTGHVTASGNISASGTLTVKNNKFFKSTETVANHQGDVVFFGSGTNFTPGTIRHYKSDGSWEIADADASSTSDGLLAVALATAPSGGMLLRGTVTLNHDPGAVGDVLYLSTTGGRATSTAPSGNTDIVRIIGYCLDASNGQIWFNPDNTFVEVNA